MPGGQRARVKSIESWPLRDEARSPRIAVAGRSVGITLDRDLFVVRGDVLSPATEPVMAGRRIRARVFWLHQSPLEVGTRIGLRIGTAEAIGSVTAIEKAIDPGRLESADARTIAQNHVGEIELRLPRSLAADPHAISPDSGQLVFELDGRIAGGGRILSIDNESLPTARATPGSDHEAPSPALAAEMTATLARLAPLLTELPPRERIARLRRELPGRLVFTTSFGLEDQVILHFMSELSVDIDVVTLDTGRLFPETYNLWAETERRYGRRIRAIYPRREGLETLVEQHGINGFYESREARLACCHVRKVEPLERALAGATGWITGLRADQSADRRDVGVLSLDADRHLLKLNPLFDCTRAAILALASANEVPINPLHEKGFASIGCAPCTRALAPGEPERAGRWWWEQDAKKECGLHTRGR